MSQEVKTLGTLSLAMLGLLIVMGLVFIVGSQYQKTTCNDIDGGFYNSGTCQVSQVNTNESQSRSYNATGTVMTSIELVLAFLTVIVLVIIARIIINIARGIKS